MKLLVKTRGPYSLMDPYTSQVIRKNGWTVVQLTVFVETQRGYQIDTVAELNDAATDEEWLKYVAESKGDLELAKAAFLSTYGVKIAVDADVVEQPTEDERPRRRRREA